MGGSERDTETARSIEHWESGLRVRCAFIAQQLIDLTLAGRDFDGGEWVGGTFASASEMADHVSGAVGRISAAYHARRQGCTETEALDAVIAAEKAIDAVGRDPAVVAFLVWGAGVERTRFRSACRLLAALLDVSQVSNSRGGEPCDHTIDIDIRKAAIPAGAGGRPQAQ